METFKRVGLSPFRHGGTTRDTDICFDGGSKLKVYGGNTYNNFRLKFSNRSNEGWWIGLDSLNQLIAELLYIRRDMQLFEDGKALDIEVGVIPFEVEELEHPEDEEEEENEAPF